MKNFIFIVWLLNSLVSFSQKWESLSSTGIRKISINKDLRGETYFQKDSVLKLATRGIKRNGGFEWHVTKDPVLILVPQRMEKDFSQLFLDDKSAFDSIYLHFYGTDCDLEDSLPYFLQIVSTIHLIRIFDLEIENQGDFVIWGLEIQGPQGRCWPIIKLKRERVNGIIKFQLISADLGLCEI